MASNDCEPSIDFSIVQTYIPGLMLFFRCLIFLSVYALLVFGMTQETLGHIRSSVRPDIVLFILATLAYFDGFFFRHDNLSRAVGFLAPPLLLIAVMSNCIQSSVGQCDDMTSNILYWVASIAWASSSTFCVLDMILRLTSVNIHIMSVGWTVAGLILLYVDCQKKGVLEIATRSLLYYVLATLLWFSQTLQPDVERNRFSYSVLHGPLHILFVNQYVMCASVCIWVLIFIYYYHSQSKSKTRRSKDPPLVKTSPKKIEAGDELLKQLQAAKQAGGIV